MTKFIRRFREYWQLHLFLLPGVVYLLIFCYYPMLGLQIAFKDYQVVNGIWGSPWVGLKHFEKFFGSIYFARVVGNTFKISLYSLLVGFPLPVLFALMLNVMRNLRLKKFVQTVTYIPHFISTVVMVGMLFQLFSPVVGIYGNLYRLLTNGVHSHVRLVGRVAEPGLELDHLRGRAHRRVRRAARGRHDRRRDPLAACLGG